jgi:hypothetical protein
MAARLAAARMGRSGWRGASLLFLWPRRPVGAAFPAADEGAEVWCGEHFVKVRQLVRRQRQRRPRLLGEAPADHG